jgi:hypothetical protein
VDYHIDRLNIMSMRGFRDFSQNHLIGRYVKKLIGIAIIEMMMMRNIRIKKAVFIVNGDTPQQTRLGKLIERVIHRANSDLQSAGPYFSGQPFGRHMAMAPVKKKRGNRDALARWSQARVTKPQSKAAFVNVFGVFHNYVVPAHNPMFHCLAVFKNAGWAHHCQYWLGLVMLFMLFITM